ncbi:3'(2'),5'-bisphosphate nucleotidase CysQ [Flexibacterium corallicola]|uniref:3'(2'),5'-bisphosphate nucleotidase CysQ n=1 Tax=Flexibacterium corallicola TaxID=3037259 RepID=UPI00286F4B71|nr:3'(2'),5'-bisphosphate nucleotidase CysQ [Pseudovibrio sp. M1P-2-3]
MIEIFKSASLKAGEVIMKFYQDNVEFSEKTDGSPVTKADQAAEDVILSILASQLPQTPVVAEEAVASGSIPDYADEFILVDPLDGTKEFINRNGEFTVNIALIQNGRPVAGVIFAPALSELYWGSEEHGAFFARVEAGNIVDPLPMKSRRGVDAIIGLGSRSHMTKETQALVERCGVDEMIAAGSSLKFCRVAKGDADLYPRLGRTMEWDTAAGHAILLAAGGKVIDQGGEELAYGKREQAHDSDFANPFFIAVGDEKIISKYDLSSGW